VSQRVAVGVAPVSRVGHRADAHAVQHNQHHPPKWHAWWNLPGVFRAHRRHSTTALVPPARRPYRASDEFCTNSTLLREFPQSPASLAAGPGGGSLRRPLLNLTTRQSPSPASGYTPRCRQSLWQGTCSPGVQIPATAGVLQSARCNRRDGWHCDRVRHRRQRVHPQQHRLRHHPAQVTKEARV